MCGLQENLGGAGESGAVTGRRQSAAAGGVAEGTLSGVPEGQPDSTKELSQSLKWANLHVLSFNSYDTFRCVRRYTVSADMLGTLTVAASIFTATSLLRWLANDMLLPPLARWRGLDMPDGGFLMFPSLESLVYDMVRARAHIHQHTRPYMHTTLI